MPSKRAKGPEKRPIRQMTRLPSATSRVRMARITLPEPPEKKKTT